jgi:uncharacterized protein (TIGR00369 family)
MMEPNQTVLRFNEMPVSPAMRLLGFRLLDFDVAEQRAICSVDIDPQLTNVMGSVHGGGIAAALDTAASVAAICASDLQALFPTLEIKCTFLEIPPQGPLRVEGRVLKLGRSIAFLESSLFSPSGTLLAKGNQTSKVLRR